MPRHLLSREWQWGWKRCCLPRLISAVFRCSACHVLRCIVVATGFKSSVQSSGNCRKSYRCDRDTTMSVQQSQHYNRSRKWQRCIRKKLSDTNKQQQNVCSVSGFQDGVDETNQNNRNNETNQQNRNFSSKLDPHSDEIDRYLKLQLSNRLKWLLKQQWVTLQRKIESRAQSIIQRKDREITQASRKTVELQTSLTKLVEESQLWRRLAQENEAVVVSLRNILERLREDAESGCDSAGRGAENEMVCRACYDGPLRVIFLPCRHLCSCKSCDSFLKNCPVCGTAKESVMEALLS